MWTLVLVALGVALFSKYLWDRWQKMQVLQNLGIPGPKPSFWIGNLAERNNLGLLPMLEKYTAEFGSVWGYYEGTRVTVVISDVDMMKDIYIKEFSKFHSRKASPLPPDKFVNLIDTVDQRQWKRLRAIGSPSFSAVKMKEMSPLLNASMDNLLELFQERCKEGRPFNIHADYQKMTMETIASCAFGIETNSIKDPNSVFLQKCRGFFEGGEKVSPLFKIIAMVMFIVPGVLHLPGAISFLSYVVPVLNYRQWFLDTAKHVIQARKNDQSNRVDFIKLMLEANEAETKTGSDDVTMGMTPDDVKGEDDVTGIQETERIVKTMSMEEMQAQSFAILIAGYETTSTALGFASYELALNPEIQRKLQDEVDEHFQEKECRPNYLTVQKLQYLEMFIHETLRLHTIADIASTRQCYETCHVGRFTIPAGTAIQMNLEGVHMNPEHWGPEDVKKCVPERFLPERKSARHPIAWVPFGAGPRNCVGMRFALMEIKIALVRLLKNFNIERCEQTQVPLEKCARIVKSPAKGVWVKLTSRD